ncbi:MAG: hypothetical protein J6B84_00715, partial [Eubacterium sp.]|nr:hypothetical protein [Eubacterium sp.]
VLIRVPQNRYFCTRCREISMMKAHSAEKQLKKSLILREKRLDYLGRIGVKKNGGRGVEN